MTRSVQQTPVLVVGGGLVGLSTALFLQQQGTPFILVEQERDVSPLPRARGWAVRSMELFRSLGLETQRFFDWCWNNKNSARQLRTPDGTRAILNTDDKIDGLRAISAELDTLAGEVAREQSNIVRGLQAPTQQIIAEALHKAYIPDAA